MKKKPLLVALLFSGLALLSACNGDSRYPRSFTVHFETGETGEKLPDQIVKEGYMLEGVSDPGNEREHIFRGWYTDPEYRNYFDVENYRVFDNLTLYAKWTFPTLSPQEISLGEDAFTKSISWVQKGFTDGSNLKIQAYKGHEVITTEYNEDYDKDLPVSVGVEYDTSSLIDVSGSFSFDGKYQVTFTVDNPGNDYYWFLITSTDSSFEDAEVKDIHFKGEGTKTNPYLVYNENDLLYLTTHSFDANTYAEMRSDVTITSVYSAKTSCVFDGHLTGSKDTAVLRSTENYVITLKNNSGLFHTLGENAEISKLSFRGSLSGSNPSMGVVANYSYGTIKEVDSQAVSVKSQGGKVNDFSTLAQGGSGGIVGTNYGLITNCTVSSARDNVVQGHIGVGGVAGINYGTITNMQVDAIVGAYNGNEISLTIDNSYSGCVAGVNFGTISKIDVYNGKINCRRIDKGVEGQGANNVGGVCGYNATGASISDCLFDGMRIVGDTNVGGIAGYNDGTIKNCYTGRRLRKPSNTTILERQFISPIIGSYHVGGIVGKCGENSVITNVFSTANVWSYQMPGYSVAEKADHAIGVSYNQSYRTSNTYLGTKYGVVYSNELLGPSGENTIMIDNSWIRGQSISWGLGFVPNAEGELVKNLEDVKTYLECLGEGFGFRDSASHGIRLMWEKSVKSYDDIFSNPDTGSDD